MSERDARHVASWPVDVEQVSCVACSQANVALPLYLTLGVGMTKSFPGGAQYDIVLMWASRHATGCNGPRLPTAGAEMRRRCAGRVAHFAP